MPKTGYILEKTLKTAEALGAPVASAVGAPPQTPSYSSRYYCYFEILKLLSVACKNILPTGAWVPYLRYW